MRSGFKFSQLEMSKLCSIFEMKLYNSFPIRGGVVVADWIIQVLPSFE